MQLLEELAEISIRMVQILLIFAGAVVFIGGPLFLAMITMPIWILPYMLLKNRK